MFKSYDEDEFYKALAGDLGTAQALVLIRTAYLARRRIGKLQWALTQCIRRRVQICAFIQSPSYFQPQSETQPESVEELREAALMLLKLGIHVTFLPAIHEKLVVIDESILWDGSLNTLSQYDSRERMTRFFSREAVYEAIKKHALDRCKTCLERMLPLRTKTETTADFYINVGKAIEKRRKQLGLTQKELAQRMSVNPSIVSRIERGNGKTSLGRYLSASAQLQLHIRFLPWYLSASLNEWEIAIAAAEETERARQKREQSERELERVKRQQPLLLFDASPARDAVVCTRTDHFFCSDACRPST